MIIMLSLRLTSLYHIVRAAGRIEGVCSTGLHFLLLQLLIGVKLLFWWRHKYLTSLGIIEFDMVDRHPHESCAHCQPDINRDMSVDSNRSSVRKQRDCCSFRWTVTA